MKIIPTRGKFCQKKKKKKRYFSNGDQTYGCGFSFCKSWKTSWKYRLSLGKSRRERGKKWLVFFHRVLAWLTFEHVVGQIFTFLYGYTFWKLIFAFYGSSENDSKDTVATMIYRIFCLALLIVQKKKRTFIIIFVPFFLKLKSIVDCFNFKS